MVSLKWLTSTDPPGKGYIGAISGFFYCHEVIRRACLRFIFLAINGESKKGKGCKKQEEFACVGRVLLSSDCIFWLIINYVFFNGRSGSLLLIGQSEGMEKLQGGVKIF
jgi:hypothetical protein